MDPLQESFEPPPDVLPQALPAPGRQSVPALPQQTPTHVVVIRSSEGKWLRRLWLPILLGLIAVAAFSYRLHAPDWVGVVFPKVHHASPPSQSDQNAQSGEPVPEFPSVEQAEEILKPVPVPVTIYGPPEETAGVKAETIPPGSAIAPPAPDVVQAVHAGASAESDPLDGLLFVMLEFLGMPAKPELEPLASDIARDILREAELVRLNEADLNRVKREQLARDDQAAAERKAQEAWLQRAQDFRDRAKFRDSLRLVLRDADQKRESYRQTAARLLELCHQAGQSMDWTQAMTPRNVAVLTREKRGLLIEKYRKERRTEPAILVELARLERRNVAARNGPRDGDEALVRAARQLLAVPLADAAALQASRPPLPDPALQLAPAPGGPIAVPPAPPSPIPHP
jgi:hypothetical protein